MTPNYIKECRERAGFKNPQRAAMTLGIDPGQYRKIERGDLGLSGRMAVKLARGFDCSTDELLGLREASA